MNTSDLTIETVDELTEQIRKVLEGKRLTSVAVRESNPYSPSVETSQEFRNVTGHKHGTFAQIILDLTDGVWSISDNAEVGIGWDRITVFQKSGSGQQLSWVFAVEKEGAK